jgi:mRNA interferase MazF
MSATPTSGKVTLMATMWARRGLTGEVLRPHLSRVTVAPITSTIRGLSTDVPVGPANGLDHDSVVSCDNIVTVRVLGRQLGVLLPEQEAQVTEAVRAAFDLD